VDAKSYDVLGLRNGFARATALSLLEDREGNMWIGSYSTGLTQYKNKLFKTYTELHGLKKDNIRAIVEDPAGTIWIGHGGGVSKFDPIHPKLHPKSGLPSMMYGMGFEHYQPQDYGASNSVWSMLADSKGSVWIGTGYGLLKNIPPPTNGGKTSVESFFQNDGKTYLYRNSKPRRFWMYERPANACMALCEDSKGYLWVGTFGGLHKLNINSGERFETYTTADGLLADRITAIHEDKKGNLWIGTTRGLSKLVPSPGGKGDGKIPPSGRTMSSGHRASIEGGRGASSVTFENFTSSDGLANDFVSLIAEDDQGNLWLGTHNGISKYMYPAYIGSRGSFRNYSTRDGLSSDTPYLLIFDDKGYLYVGTNRGVDKFNIKGDPIKLVKHFGKLEGFRGIETNHNAACKDSYGNLWFGTVHGAIKYDPKLDKPNNIEPVTNITKLLLFFKNFKWSAYSDTIDNQTGLPAGLTLPYDQNHLTFQFIGVSLTIPEKVKYQWKLEKISGWGTGGDKHWSPITQRTEATYSNLPPGDYAFKIISCNNDGKWNKEPTTFSFNILPPWYQTLLFYLACGFTGLGGIIGFIKIREGNLQRKKRILEEKVKIRTKEISRQKKELEKLSIVASKTDNAVLIANAEGKLEWANEGFTKMSGYTLEEFKEEKGETMMEMSNNPEIKQVIDDCINKRSSVVYEVKNMTKGGNEIWVQTTLTPIIENGTFKRLVAIDTDITDRKNAEEVIRQKNIDITDSINYAQHIQQAILPNPEEIQSVLPDSFILFKPKAIVSGDFYWFSKIESENRGRGETEKKKKMLNKKFTDSPIHPFSHSFIIAAVDCTGHGVPGAFMSVIGNDLLNDIVNNRGTADAAKILGELNDGVVNALKQKGEEGEAKDGMDIALCSIDLHKKELQFSGAYNPLYMIRDKQLEIFKGSRYPIGMYKIGKDKKFTNHHIKIKKGDAFYIFSDGYADQFGGSKGKKFTYKRFQDLLIEIQQHSMEKQRDILNVTFEKWKGDEEQLDDVLVIGIRI